MRGALRLLLALAVCCVVAFGWSASSLASSSVEGVEAPSAASAPTPPVSLAAPFGEVPQLTAQQVAADATSRTAFEGLDREAAVSLAKRVFQVGRASWTAPGSEPGESIGRYLGEDAAVDRLSNGKHVVVASSIPLRVDSGSGLAPTSLALHEVEGAYVPANPVVPVAIAKQLAEGIAFPAGLSVTPVSAATSEAPEVVGNRVLFANMARDTDWIAEPRPAGAEVSWQLRSQESPQSQSLAFHLPKGAVLQWSTSIPGGVEVLVEGEPLMLVPPAVARDAEGNTIPTSYSLNGDVLTTHVDLSGNVAFPVLVDPLLFYGYYGTKNGANVWSGWQASAPTGYFGEEKSASWYKIGTNPSAPVGTYGALTITAPGPAGKSGSAGITRVDLTGVQHGAAGQSRLISTINESNGPLPVYSYNGTLGAYGPLPLYEGSNLSGQAIAFCASSAGGHDGNKEGENPLCDEVNYQGHVFVLEDEITSSPQSAYNWVLMEGAQVTYRDPAGPNKVVLNTVGYTGQWLKTGPTNWKIEGEDEGLGLAHFELQIPAGHSPTFTQNINCTAQNGFTGCPSAYTSEAINLSGLGTGAFSLAPVATDAAENVSRPEASYTGLYLDQAPPVIGELTGNLAEAAGGVIGDGNYTLNFDPVDGSTSSPQSGVQSLEIKVDGQHAYTDPTGCPTPKGVPAENCFGLSGSWTMNGQAYGAGPHTITVIAKDWLGNESTRSFSVTVNEAAYQPIGAGAVNLETGDYKLNPTDVSLSGGATTLTVSRIYDSRKLTQGIAGPLGPQWMLSLPGSASAEEWQSLTPLPEGAVAVYNARGGQLIFSPKEGGGYNSPAGYQTETLTEPSTSPATYQMTDSSGSYTQFKQPSSGAPFVPSSVVQASGAGGLNKVSYSFTKTAEGITEPTEVLAPEPTEGACVPTLVKGCRALTFNYASSTTATGEGPAEWGDYKGRLTRVFLSAWDPAKGEMTTTTVAQYAFDKQGRLRAEWDPRITPALKMTYGYDAENHVVAINVPGEQPWLLNYGAGASDPVRGRLIATTRPNASTAFGAGNAPVNTSAPSPSTTTPALGVAVSVTNGSWSNTPLSYSYQWEDCNATGGECTPIPSATNPTYTPVLSDARHTLIAQVTAINSGGGTTASTSASSVVPLALNTSNFGSAGNKEGQLEDPQGIAVNATTGNVFVSSRNANRVEEFNSKGEYVAWIGSPGSGAGQMNHPEAVALHGGDIYIGDGGNSRIDVFTEKGEYVTEFGSSGNGNGQFSGAIAGIAITGGGEIYASDTADNRVEELAASGEYITQFGSQGNGNGQFTGPTGVSLEEAKHGSNLYVVNSGGHNIEQFTSSGSWLKTFGSTRTEGGSLRGPAGIATNYQTGTLYVSDYSSGSAQVAEFTTAGAFIGSFGTYGAGAGQFESPLGIAVTTSGSTTTLDIADQGTDRIGIWNATAPTSEPTPTPPNPGTSAVTTLEYHVALTGLGAPHEMTASTLEKWAQSDLPADATAIFPADEPEGWPAQDYKRANLFYMDSANRTVNTASPSGAISTIEYASNDNVTRMLTADNRAAALKEGRSSAEASRLLDSENTYSADGTELLSTLGPQHTVKLANGSETLARKHTQYFYDEGAPETGGPYRLPTKTIEGAQVAGGEEKDLHTVTKLYSGQKNLGWKLHTPTSVITSTGSQTLTSTTTYEEATGNVTATTAPAAANSYPVPVYFSQFGKAGSEAGALSSATGIALDNNTNVWIADTANNRVEEFSATGAFIQTFGWGVTNGKEELQVCKASCRVGLAGTGKGQLSGPQGIAYDTSNNRVYVSDTANNRVEVFSKEGGYELSFGARGSGSGQFFVNTGITVDTASNHIWVADLANSRLEVFSAEGEWLSTIGKAGKGNGAFEAANDVVECEGNMYAVDYGGQRVEEFTTAGSFIRAFGKAGQENGQFSQISRIACGAKSSQQIYVTDQTANRVEVFSTTGSFTGSFGATGSASGQFNAPMGIAGPPETWPHGSIFVLDSANNRVERWEPGPTATHTTETIYYTTAANPTHPGCGSHPEWAGLPCQGQPGAQPETAGLPNLPVTTYTYNLWDEPLSIVDTAGTTTRTTTVSYDAAGRTKTSTITSTADTPVAPVTDEYNAETGALTKQTSEGRTVTSVENTLGQQTAYTDADGNTTKYEYEKEADARLITLNDGKGTQTISYDATTGLVASVKDSAAGTFTAGRDIEGNLITEGYPNGMTATRTLNQVGEATGLEYVKTTHCSSSCTWYSDTVTPSIHSQWLSQTSTLSKQSYSYDATNRLTEVQDTPAGKGCTVRLYALDEDGNRTSQITREPGSEGKCATEGGSSQTWGYDTADRLDETGVTYDPFGNTTTLPAQDAGSTALTSTYYVSDTLASQKQNGETIAYNLDPTSRTRETVSTGTTNSTVIAHYADQSDSPAWTANGSTWTRYITGIGGGLTAIQTNGETPILQLANLHGDIIATAALSETETKPLSTSDTTEYGVPRTSTPAKYSWLGAEQRPTELPTGIINMGARTYIPQLGRFEQTDPQPGGSANAYAYTFGDPVNSADPNGEWTSTVSYNYEAASTGSAESGLPESYAGPGAIEPPPVNMQIEDEFIAHPPWDASSAFMSEGGGGGTGLLRHGGVADVLASPGEMNRYCTTKHELALPSGGCLHNIAWQNAKAHKAPWSVKKALLKCVFGAASYGLVGLVIDAVKLSPAGAAASCLLGEVAP